MSKFVYCRNRASYENFKLKICTCAQIHALGTRTNFQLEILSINVISDIVYFRKIILKSSRNVSETTPRNPLILFPVTVSPSGSNDALFEPFTFSLGSLESRVCYNPPGFCMTYD